MVGVDLRQVADVSERGDHVVALAIETFGEARIVFGRAEDGGHLLAPGQAGELPYPRRCGRNEAMPQLISRAATPGRQRSVVPWWIDEPWLVIISGKGPSPGGRKR